MLPDLQPTGDFLTDNGSVVLLNLFTVISYIHQFIHCHLRHTLQALLHTYIHFCFPHLII
jgi:hypothetical protein